jgi:hypothetical protein
MINYSGPNSNHVLTAGQKHQNLPSNQQTDFQAVHTEHLAICTLLLCGRGRVIRKNGPPVHPRPSHETPHSRQLRFFTSETPKTLILCPAPASSSDTFRKGVTSGTPPPSVRNRRGFRPWKTVLRSTTPSTGEATPRDVTVIKAFAQENPSTMPSEGPAARGQKQATSAAAALTHKPRSYRRGHCCPLVVATHHHREPDPTVGLAVPTGRPQHTSPPPLLTAAPLWGARPPALHNRHRPQGRQIRPPDLQI